MKRPKKVMILGLDAPIVPRLYKYAMEGKLPAFARIIRKGVWAKNCLVPLPTITPPNWTAIATGAWPSSTGITDFNVHYPGEALNRTHGGFYSGDVRVETVWNAIARAGKKSVIINYPATWPPNIKNGYQIGGGGVDVNHYFWPASAFGGLTEEPPQTVDDETAFRFAQHGVEAGGAMSAPRCSLSYERIFVTKPFESSTPAAQPFEAQAGQGRPDVFTLKKPDGWVNVPPAKKALAAELVVRPSSGRFRMERPVWYILVLDTQGSGFDRVIVCDRKDASSPMAVLEKGKWAPIIIRDFPTEAGPKRAGFTMKLLELSTNAEDIRIYHSCICGLDGMTYPESLSKEIRSAKGLPYPVSGFTGFDRGWFGTDTVLEIAELEREWWTDACTYILKNKPWDLFLMQYHLPDHAWHSISWMMDPTTAKSDVEWRQFQEVELATYQVCDRFAKDIFACADENETVFALISDHGAKATNAPYPNLQAILEKAGLLVRGTDGRINWSKTKATGQRSVYVYVNLKGRDPNGIVEPGTEYRQVQEQVIRALTDYVDPATGRKPIVFALKKEDARFINIYGDRVGDVVYALSEHYGGQHGPHLPTAEWGLGSLRGLWAMAGPGIKKGVELERNVWCLDMIPTLCFLTGWPIPKDAEGAVIYQALEDPNPDWR